MTRYTPTVDFDAIEALDIHTHVSTSVHGATEADRIRHEQMSSFFKSGKAPAETVSELAAYYRERRMAAVAFSVDSGPDSPATALTSDEIIDLAIANSDAVIPFGSVHPARPDAPEIAERLIGRGVLGFKFHPSGQHFFPNDQTAYPIFEVLDAHKIPALFHSGQSGAGAGVRGGGGIRLKYSNPMHLDDVAVDFPDMPIVIAHPSFPWQEEALAVAVHKPQVFIDLSGWSPKYFPPILVQYANTMLRDKVLFGSDFPLITPERWMADLTKAGIRDEVLPGLLKNNARRLLGL